MTSQTPLEPLPEISTPRLEECLESAAFWTERLPRYASTQQTKADCWAIAAGVLSAITGLAVWPTFDADSDTAVQLVVSAGAFLTALCVLVPRVKNYAEHAGDARQLTTQYAEVKGQLLDILSLHREGKDVNQETQRSVVATFKVIKSKKDLLRYLPERHQGANTS